MLHTGEVATHAKVNRLLECASGIPVSRERTCSRALQDVGKQQESWLWLVHARGEQTSAWWAVGLAPGGPSLMA